MTNTADCTRCGTPVPEVSSHGLCSRCLLELGFGADGIEGAATLARPADSTGEESATIEDERIGAYRLVRLLGEGGCGLNRRTIHIFRFYDGSLSPEQLVELAISDNPREERIRLCDAYFHFAQWHLHRATSNGPRISSSAASKRAPLSRSPILLPKLNCSD